MTDPVFIHPLPAASANVVGTRVRLTGAELKHALVKRMERGETIVVSNGIERAVRGTWEGQGEVLITEMLDFPSPTPRVTVAQAIPKSERAELAVDLMVQAGVDRITPWASQRTIAKWDGKEDKARAKWANAAMAAAKQARRLRVPEITPLARSTADILRIAATPEPPLVLVLHEEAIFSLKAPEVQERLGAAQEVILVVGPEGGVAPAELEQLEASGGLAIKLGPEVLRTATAGCVALAAIGVMTSRW